MSLRARPGPRVVIGALRGGSGKTLVTTGLVAAWRARGLAVAPFKKGPDYIDPAWISRAAGRPCRSLDPHLMPDDVVLRAVAEHGADADVVVVEGNHGLMDGVGAGAAGSTAALAGLLRAPVVVIADCTRATRTVAAMVLGCQALDPALRLAGVILNRVATRRQEAAIRTAVEEACGIPVLGSIPRLPDLDLPERHLGLLTPAEHRHAEGFIARAEDVVEVNVDVDAVWAAAQAAPPLRWAGEPEGDIASVADPVRIGVVRDRAFTFYYVENLERLERLGAELVWVDALADGDLPPLDALYVGGGYPETHAAALAANAGFRAALRRRIAEGLPVVAECGGLIYLADAYVVQGVAHPMVGVFPVTFELGDRPLGHGYTALEVESENAFFPPGTRLRGHEFRYSRPRSGGDGRLQFAFRMTRGFGFDGQHDGLVSGNVLASFCHFHVGGAPGWAEAVVRAARNHRAARRANLVSRPACVPVGSGHH